MEDHKNSSRSSNNYAILYEDGDREHIAESQMPTYIRYYNRRDRLLGEQEKRLVEWRAQEAAREPPKKKQKVIPKRKKPNAVVVKTEPKSVSPKIKYMVTPSKESKASSSTKEKKPTSLWKFVSVSRETVQDLVRAHPPSQIPPELHVYLPNMIEFYLLLWQRQMLFLLPPEEAQTKCSPHFLSRHFCNNYRELDRGTGYLRSELLRLKDDLETDGLWPMTRVEWTTQVLGMAYHYRLCNRLSSFLGEHNPARGIPRVGQFDDTFTEYARGIKDGGTWFTNAHNTIKFEEYLLWCTEASQNNTIPALAEEIVGAGTDIKKICNLLTTLNGIGDFQKWQLFCDLEEAGCIPRERKDNYVVLGPGADAGLIDIFGAAMVKGGQFSRLELATIIRDNLAYGLGRVEQEFPLWKGEPLTLKVVEHALCEFNKFLRIDLAKKKLRKYNSRASYDKGQCSICKVNKTESNNKEWLRCDTCRDEFCSSCQKDGYCGQSSIPCKSTRSMDCTTGLLNLWRHCRRCDALDSMKFESD